MPNDKADAKHMSLVWGWVGLGACMPNLGLSWGVFWTNANPKHLLVPWNNKFGQETGRNPVGKRQDPALVYTVCVSWLKSWFHIFTRKNKNDPFRTTRLFYACDFGKTSALSLVALIERNKKYRVLTSNKSTHNTRFGFRDLLLFKYCITSWVDLKMCIPYVIRRRYAAAVQEVQEV